ncbi:MAG TPA: hypothetical protein VGC53_09435 [Vicinamibacteria bacterium]|jgi:hypothetical protein
MQPPEPGVIDATNEKSVYWLSFGLRCALGFLAWWVSWYTDFSLVEDAVNYENLGRRIALEWMSNGTSLTLQSLMEGGRQAWGMVLVLAVISFVLRGARALPVVIVVFNFMTAWTPVLIYRIARQLGQTDLGALHAARLVVFSPVFAFWGGALYKEGLVFFVLSIITYHVLVLQEGVRGRSILMVVLGIAALSSLRFYLAVLLLPSIILGLLLARRSKGRSGLDEETPSATVMRRLVVLGALTVLLVVSGTSAGILEILPENTRELFGQVQSSRDDLATASSGYLRGTDVSNPIAALKFLPLGVFYFLTVPLPWQFGSLRQSLVIPEMIFWLIQYPRIFLGMKLGLRRHFSGSLLLISITLAITCLYGLFVSNVGTAYRLRAQVWLLWTVFAGWRRDQEIAALEGGEVSGRSLQPLQPLQ